MKGDTMINQYLDIIRSKRDEFIRVVKSEVTEFPNMRQVSSLISEPTGSIEGRDMEDLRRALRNPEKANVALLADPGAGKTAYVQGFSFDPESIQYLVISIDPERFAIGAKDAASKDSAVSNGLTALAEEAKLYSEKYNIIVCIFIDEFHRIPMLAPSSIEAMKPILEHSAQNGFRMILATTYEEYLTWIVGNRALDQRIIPITVKELPKTVVLSILKKRADVHGLTGYYDPEVFGDIYDTSKSILLSNSQPRASLDLLLDMVGLVTKSERMEHGELVREYATPSELNIHSNYILSRPILNRVVQRRYGIDIDHKVDLIALRKKLKTVIKDQDYAIERILGLLAMAQMGFIDPTRPKASFLTPGTTGVGKTEVAKQAAEGLGIPFIRFDMQRYPNSEDAKVFADDLARAGWSYPNGYFLFDEIEKSSREAMNSLLQVLDDARLSAPENPNKIISFAGTIIHLTTNEGAKIMAQTDRVSGVDSVIDENLIYKDLIDSDVLASEILGRIDEIIPFSPLSNDTRYSIAREMLTKELSNIETHERIVKVSDEIVPYVVLDRVSSDADSGGARDIKRAIRNIVLRTVSVELIDSVEECPIVIHLIGEPRYKQTNTNSDPLSAMIKVTECHRKSVIAAILKRIGEQVGRHHLVDAGLFVPKKVYRHHEEANQYTPNDLMEYDVNVFVSDIVSLIRQGYSKFATKIVEDQFYVVGVA